MSDYPKYRLKKDTPNFEAGNIFVIHSDEDSIFPQASDFIYDPRGNYYDSVGNIKHFDEWFEDLGSQKWTRKQIKQIEFGEHKLVCVFVRFIKHQIYIGYDDEFGDVIAHNEPREIKRIYFHADDNGSWRQKDYDTLNQLVRDGYIEIQDSPNIVWEEL